MFSIHGLAIRRRPRWNQVCNYIYMDGVVGRDDDGRVDEDGSWEDRDRASARRGLFSGDRRVFRLLFL